MLTVLDCYTRESLAIRSGSANLNR
jgi:hypothetical protein